MRQHPAPRKITLGAALNSWLLVLGLYWMAPVLLVTLRLEQPAWVLAAATVLYAVGVVLMMGSDAQKFFVLKVRGYRSFNQGFRWRTAPDEQGALPA